MYPGKVVHRFFVIPECSHFEYNREEWQWLHKSNDENSIEDEYAEDSLQLFQSQFQQAIKELFSILSKKIEQREGEKDCRMKSFRSSRYSFFQQSNL